MRKKQNKLALRVLSAAAVMAIVTSIAAPAFADAYGIATYGNFNLKDGDIYVEVKDGKHYVKQIETVDSEGNITYAKDKDGNDINGTKAEDDDQVTVLGEGKETDNIINIRTDDDKQTADITLDKVNIHAEKRNRVNESDYSDDKYNEPGQVFDRSALEVSGAGTTNIELNGDNKLIGGLGGGAGLAFNDVDRDGKKNGTLNINDKEGDGSLYAKSGSFSAGIGGEKSHSSGNIVINGGTITAKSTNGAGAGIGGGQGWAGWDKNVADEDCGNGTVTINGGNVTAIGAGNGAGIGGGSCGWGTVTINGGTVNARSNGGAGIGGGCKADGKVTIAGGTIENATSSSGGAGIGGGDEGNGTVTITGGTIENAAGGQFGGAGIGGGSEGSADITIDGTREDGTPGVTIKNATGNGGAGIGAGADGDTAKVAIKNAEIDNTTGGADRTGGAGIGGESGSKTTIAIRGGSDVTAKGGSGFDGIGGGPGTTVTIEDSKVDASTDTNWETAGISGDTVTISNSTVKASGKTGIGGNGSTVTIENKSNITASGTYGVGIGGYGKADVTIKDSTIESATTGTNNPNAGIGSSINGSGTVKIIGSTVKNASGSIGIGSGTGTVTIEGSNIVNAEGSTLGISGGEINILEKSHINNATGGSVGIGGRTTKVTVSGATIDTVKGDTTGIGGSSSGSKADVTITDSTVGTVTGEKGAGIGGGNDSTIKITGKTSIDTVTGSTAGIGTNGGTITIDGATLGTVTGKNGSGIGTTTGNKVGITIKNGKITTITGSGQNRGGIDGGYNSNINIEKSDIGSVTGGTIGIGTDSGQQSTVTIDGSHLGTVTGNNGTGIGINNVGGLTIGIRGSTIDKVLGKNGSGIGAGPQFSASATIDIDKSTISSVIGENGSGIGVGNNFNPSATAGITVNDSTIGSAEGSNGNAGIGGGFGNLIVKLFNSIIRKAKGGTDSAQRGGAGIGNGAYSNPSNPLGSTNITISNTNIDEAVGGAGAAGIGGGIFRDASVTISGGKITARAGEESNAALNLDAPFAIGSGALPDVPDFKKFSDVTITGDDGDTIVNAIASDKEHAISQLQNITVDSLGEVHKVLINMRDAGGKILKAIHNRAYVGYPADAEEAEAHAWDGGVIIREATPTRKGLKLYTCTVDGCGATKVGEYDYEWLNVSVIFWDTANQAAAPAYLQGKTLNVENTAATVAATQADSVLADKAHWKMAENAGELEIHPAADAVGTIYEQAVKASGCQYYVIANVTAQ